MSNRRSAIMGLPCRAEYPIWNLPFSNVLNTFSVLRLRIKMIAWPQLHREFNARDFEQGSPHLVVTMETLTMGVPFQQ